MCAQALPVAAVVLALVCLCTRADGARSHSLSMTHNQRKTQPKLSCFCHVQSWDPSAYTTAAFLVCPAGYLAVLRARTSEFTASPYRPQASRSC